MMRVGMCEEKRMKEELHENGKKMEIDYEKDHTWNENEHRGAVPCLSSLLLTRAVHGPSQQSRR